MNREPLANRMKPKDISEIVGQKKVFGQNTMLYNMVKNDELRSLILYGPPGTGKTSIATVIANMTKSDFHKVNAVQSGKKDLENVIKIAQSNLENDTSTILFIDEIHRFNKAQQDYLLPFVEDGTIILIGATTENPYFEVNGALTSRAFIVQLEPLTDDDIKEIVIRAVNDAERGIASLGYGPTLEAVDYLCHQANGDTRYALNLLELAAFHAPTNPNSVDSNGKIYITKEDVDAVIMKPHMNYDKDGDYHYDTISAFIKSMRGSDPDATLYYLARMLENGEDPKFIARRLMVHAAEDVGIADPQALTVATSASLAVERIGLPEGRIILAEAALYIALAPKSCSVIAGIDKAMEYVKMNPSDDVPNAMRDAHYKSAPKLGHGIGYLYPHDYPNHWVNQRYLPDSVNETFYKSDGMGYQQAVDRYQNAIKH